MLIGPALKASALAASMLAISLVTAGASSVAANETRPTVAVKAVYSLHTSNDAVGFRFLRASGCTQGAPGPITVTVNGSRGPSIDGATTISEILSAPCGGDWTNLQTAYWGRFETAADDSGSRLGPYAEFQPRFDISGLTVLRYKVASSGLTLDAGEVDVSTVVVPDKDVYQGTDAFVNYCIDQSKAFYSSGGRLYCIQPGFTSYRIRLFPSSTLSLRRFGPGTVRLSSRPVFFFSVLCVNVPCRIERIVSATAAGTNIPGIDATSSDQINTLPASGKTFALDYAFNGRALNALRKAVALYRSVQLHATAVVTDAGGRQAIAHRVVVGR